MKPMCAKRFLIVNADDFGFSTHTVQATIECFRRGVLSSATIMANMAASELAVEYAVNHPEFSFGVHLCLTDEKPVSNPERIRSLIAPSGLLWPTREFLKRAFTGRIARNDLCTEISAQLNRLRDGGVPISHIDGHGHIHKFPPVLSALRGVLRAHGLLAVRRTQDVFYKKTSLASRCYNTLANIFVKRLGPTTDHFLMVAGTLSGNDAAWWADSIQCLPEGLTEIGIHPGFNEEWRKLETVPVLEDAGHVVREAMVTIVTYKMVGMLQSQSSGQEAP